MPSLSTSWCILFRRSGAGDGERMTRLGRQRSTSISLPAVKGFVPRRLASPTGKTSTTALSSRSAANSFRLYEIGARECPSIMRSLSWSMYSTSWMRIQEGQSWSSASAPGQSYRNLPAASAIRRPPLLDVRCFRRRRLCSDSLRSPSLTHSRFGRRAEEPQSQT
jgi:hypothetical protein